MTAIAVRRCPRCVPYSPSLTCIVGRYDRRHFKVCRRMSSFPVSASPAVKDRTPAPGPLTVLIVVPSLDVGAADTGAVELVRILTQAGHRAIVASSAGRLVADVTAAGGEFFALDVASNNPLRILRNAVTLARLARERHCDAIHALGRAGAWSAFIAARARRIPFLTSWFKGFREQNYLQALLQRHHGARRPRDRRERAARATRQRPLRHAVGQNRGGALQHRRRPVRPGAGRHASASRRSAISGASDATQR